MTTESYRRARESFENYNDFYLVCVILIPKSVNSVSRHSNSHGNRVADHGEWEVYKLKCSLFWLVPIIGWTFQITGEEKLHRQCQAFVEASERYEDRDKRVDYLFNQLNERFGTAYVNVFIIRNDMNYEGKISFRKPKFANWTRFHNTKPLGDSIVIVKA